MSIVSALRTIFAQQLLPGELAGHRFGIPQSIVLLNDNHPVFIRLNLGETGFIDLRIGDGDNQHELVAVGTGRGELRVLPSIYPRSFNGRVSARSVQDPALADLIPKYIKDWDGRDVDDIINDPAAGANANVESVVHWFDRQLSLQAIAADDPNWCVPAAMAKLSRPLYGEDRDADHFAQRWGQKKGELFVETNWYDDDIKHLTTWYGRLREVCLEADRMVESLASWNQLRSVSYDWIKRLGKATLFVEGEHADVGNTEVAFAALTIYGATPQILHSYATVGTTGYGTAWFAYQPKEDLLLRFAFTMK